MGRALTAVQLAELHGKTKHAVTKWVESGLPVKERGRRGKPSLYDEDEVAGWLAAREEEAQQDGRIDGIQARARKEMADALLKEQMLALRAGELVPRETHAKALQELIAGARSKLLALPMALADRLHREAMLHGVTGVQETLKTAIAGVLTELSRSGGNGALSEPEPKPKRVRKKKATKKKGTRKR